MQGRRSTATAEAEVRTTASSVDIEAERRSTMITANKAIVRLLPERVAIRTSGITESRPPAGNSGRISLDVLPIVYAPQPMIRQNSVEITVARLIAALSFIA